MSNDRNQPRGIGNRLSEQTVLTESVLASTSAQPRIVSVVNNDGPNNSYVGNQGSTNDNTPLLRGWGEPGATLTITKSTDANDVLGTVTVDQNGMWSYQVPADDALANGGHTFIARQFDDAGQQVSRSEPYFVNVAAPVSAGTPVEVTDSAAETVAATQAAPGAPALDTVQDNVTVWGGIQNIQNGQSTQDLTPTLKGRGEPGATITITNGDQVLGTTKVGMFGTWTYQVSAEAPLEGGTYALVVTQTNSDGQTSPPSQPYVFTVIGVDAPPAPTIDVVYDNVMPGGGWETIDNGQSSDDRTPLLQGRAERGATVTISVDGEVLGTVIAGPFGNWQYQVSDNAALTNGTHEFTVSQVAQPGGPSSQPSQPYVLIVTDVSAPPAPTIDVVYDNVTTGGGWENIGNGQSTDDRTPLLQGRAERGATVTISVDGEVLGTVIAGPFGNWEYQVLDNAALANGTHEFSVSQIAQSGGPSSQPSQSYVITVIDLVSTPVVTTPTIDALIDNVGPVTGELMFGERSDDSRPTLVGTADSGALVTVAVLLPNGSIQTLGSVHADENGRWDFTPTSDLPAGQSYFEAVASVDGVESGVSNAHSLIVDVPGAASTSAVADIIPLDTGVLELGNAAQTAESKANGGEALHKLALGDVLSLDAQNDLLTDDSDSALSALVTGNPLSLEDVTGQLDVSPDAITTGGVEHSYSFPVSNEFDLHVQELATQAG